MRILHRMHMPETHPIEAVDRCPEVLATWLAHAPGSVPVKRDWEDFYENAVMLHELAELGPVEILAPKSKTRMIGSHLHAPHARPGAERGAMFGMFNSSDPFEFPSDVDLAWNAAERLAPVIDYARSPVFLRHAERFVRMCDMERAQIVDALREMHDAGMRRGFCKTVVKGLATTFDMGEDRDRLFRDMDPEDDIGWMLVANEGRKAAFIVQGAIEPTFEYRVIVVGDRIVSGAGCIEAHTPIDGVGMIFDDRMERVRNSGEVSIESDLAVRYEAFARDYVADWSAAHGTDAGYSLDLCVDAATGAVVPIEMNPLMNLGLYANRADLLAQAMVGAA